MGVMIHQNMFEALLDEANDDPANTSDQRMVELQPPVEDLNPSSESRVQVTVISDRKLMARMRNN